MKKTIVLDFDGVLHSYLSGWKGELIIPDPPVPGMSDLCLELSRMGYELVVLSSRARSVHGASAIVDWLKSHGFPSMKVTAEKVPAEVYVDDRGYRFDGNPGALLSFIAGGGMVPWNKGLQAP